MRKNMMSGFQLLVTVKILNSFDCTPRSVSYTMYEISYFYLCQVCHHYLVPLLSQISLDASLLKRDTSQSNHGSMGPPDSLQEKSSEENGDSSKESSDPLQGDVSFFRGKAL